MYATAEHSSQGSMLSYVSQSDSFEEGAVVLESVIPVMAVSDSHKEISDKPALSAGEVPSDPKCVGLLAA
jgi:hypothetical protein